MKKSSIIVGLLMLVVGLGIGYSLIENSASTGNSVHTMGDDLMMGQNIDQRFIVEMIPHHEGAIAMAKIALERSKRPEMLLFAQGIIEAQEKEIGDMRGWYQSWFGSAPTASGMAGEPNVLMSVSDAEFDRELIAHMIPHHEMAVMMAQMLQTSTGRSEMKQLAGTIIASQSAEIETMRGWLKVWYGQ